MLKGLTGVAVLAGLLVVGTARGDDPTPPDEATQQLISDYYAEIAIRPEWNRGAIVAHTAEVRSYMAGLDGSTIVDTSAGTFVWNSSIGNVELWVGTEQQSLTLFVDGVGRVAFEGSSLDGFVDTLDDENLFFLLEVDGATTLWVGEIGGATSNVVMVNPTKCLCAGSNDVCANGRIACPAGASCSYSNGGGTHSSTCMWLIAPS